MYVPKGVLSWAIECASGDLGLKLPAGAIPLVWKALICFHCKKLEAFSARGNFCFIRDFIFFHFFGQG